MFGRILQNYIYVHLRFRGIVLYKDDFRIIRIRILSALTRICIIHRFQYCFQLSSHSDFVEYLDFPRLPSTQCTLYDLLYNFHHNLCI
jgi:hypothetical protein